ncbi:hypothetical protein [Streptomyces sp. enrichment culture]|uniref:hypothetical protein n=1 Tax=Streptomyces sp. enrichment culture TaxID=1795815 RepID=UPI003F556873
MPVLLTEEDEGRDMAATAAFEPLVTSLRALRSFDPRIVESLALRPSGRSSGTPEDVLAADSAGDPRQHMAEATGEGGPADEDQDQEAGPPASTARPVRSWRYCASPAAAGTPRRSPAWSAPASCSPESTA